MNTQRNYLPLCVILLCSACVDRIIIDTGFQDYYAMVIDGFISDEPGPYVVKVTNAYDIESKSSLRVPLSVKQMTISDDQGTNEKLSEVTRGTYMTSQIQGTVGRVYTLRIETLDGRVYESLPDTLFASGTVDSVYLSFRKDIGVNSIPQYGFDVFFNSSAGNLHHYNFLWKFTGTFKFSVSCCPCWTNLTNTNPIVSDNQLIQGGRFIGVKASYVPVTAWTFLDKVHAEVSQRSLSRQSFDFWRSVGTQLKGVNSLFQPVTGKIPSNFVQRSGHVSALQGIFYATSITRNAVFIHREDIPDINFIPKLELAGKTQTFDPASRGCNDLFPNSTSVKPYFWGD